jgi:uncharacterized membrane protein YhaH (DUF805 family)
MHYYTDVLKKYTLFSGRATRTEFWMFILLSFIASAILGVVDRALKGNILENIYSLAVLLPSLAVTSRRLHDMGKSFWWVLINLIPIVGWIMSIVFLATDSQPGQNMYGPNPKETPMTPPENPTMQTPSTPPVTPTV